ncbi:MAG TPA: carboxypeptidase regulatory-like domain-containing protein [Planctomycetes bacterium]|nr:carboxypeptidase regulatory-like domain-containing protein [Planctomycetota bacterium]
MPGAILRPSFLLPLSFLFPPQAQKAPHPPKNAKAQTSPGAFTETPQPTRYKVIGLIRDASGNPMVHAEIHAYGDIREGLPRPVDPDILHTRSDNRGRFRLKLLPGRPYRAFGFNNKSPGRFRITALSEPFFAKGRVHLRAVTIRARHKLQIQLGKPWRGRGPYRVELRPLGGNRRWILSLPRLGEPISLPLLPGKRASLRLFDKTGAFLLAAPLSLDQDIRIEGKGAYKATLHPKLEGAPRPGLPLFLLCDLQAIPLGSTRDDGTLPFALPAFELHPPFQLSSSKSYRPGPFRLFFFQARSPFTALTESALGMPQSSRSGIPSTSFATFHFPVPKAKGRLLRVLGFDGKPLPHPKVFLVLPPPAYGEHPFPAEDPFQRTPRGILLEGDETGQVLLPRPQERTTLYEAALVQLLLDRRAYKEIPPRLRAQHPRATPTTLVPFPSSSKPLSPFEWNLKKTQILHLRVEASSNEERRSDCFFWVPRSPKKAQGTSLYLGTSHIRTQLDPLNRATLLLSPVPRLRYAILEPNGNHCAGTVSLPANRQARLLLPIPPASPVSGRVENHRGEALAGVMLSLSPVLEGKPFLRPKNLKGNEADMDWFHSLRPFPILSTETDARGRFQLLLPLNHKKAVLTASKAKFNGNSLLISQSPSSSLQDLLLTLTPK